MKSSSAHAILLNTDINKIFKITKIGKDLCKWDFPDYKSLSR